MKAKSRRKPRAKEHQRNNLKLLRAVTKPLPQTKKKENNLTQFRDSEKVNLKS